MIRRLTALAIAFLTLFGCAHLSFATPEAPDEIKAITTNSVLLYEANSGTVLYEKDSTTPVYPASTTKILTAIIVIDICEGSSLLGDLNTYYKDELENGTFSFDEGYEERTFSFDDVVTVNSVERRGSVLGLSEGEEVTVSDLLYGMMLLSGNDCAWALARYFSPNIEDGGFRKLMNSYAKELGAQNSNFLVPHGLHEEDHKTTAYDLALITQYALKNRTFREIISTPVYNIPATNRHSEGFVVENTNRLIHTKEDDDEVYKYEYAIGVKTGDTTPAGRCIVSAAEKNGLLLIAVLLGDYESSHLGSPRYVNSKLLFEYGFNNFSIIKASELNINPTLKCDIQGTDVGTATLEADLENVTLCVHNDELSKLKDEADSFTIVTNFNNGSKTTLQAPINAGDIVGTAQYINNGEVVLTANLIATISIDDNTTTGSAATQGSIEADFGNNDWIFWALVAALVLVIIIIVMLITKQPVRKRNSQLRRRSRRRF